MPQPAPADLKLKVSVSPADVVSDGKSEVAVQIRVTDASGKPCKDQLPVRLTSKAARIDEEKPLEMTEKVIGTELIDLSTGGKAKLLHTVQTFGPLKNIHNYFDERNFAVRTTMTMLNQTIDLLLEGYDLPKGKK